MDLSVIEGMTVSDNTIILLAITWGLLVLLPLTFLFVWRQKCNKKIHWKSLLAGAIGFVVTARVLELLVHYFCVVMDNPVSRLINSNAAAYVLYGCLMAGIFEEVGRYVIIKKISPKSIARENAVTYGIGHGGIEVWIVVLPMIALYMAIAVTVKQSGLDVALQTLGVTEEVYDSAIPSFVAVAQYSAGSMFAMVYERIVAMFLQIALTIVVVYGLQKDKPLYLLYAVLAHAAADAGAALYQFGIFDIWMCEAWLSVAALVLVLLAIKLYGKMSNEETL